MPKVYSKENPCKPDCPKRSPTCHFTGVCKEYAEWLASGKDIPSTMGFTPAHDKCIKQKSSRKARGRH